MKEGITLNVTIKDARVSAVLAGLRERSVKMREPLDMIGQEIEENVQLGFLEGRDPYGNSWAPLVLRKGQPLIDTGRMRASITHNVNEKSVVVGTNLESGGVFYPAVHQFGATILPRNAKALTFKAGASWFRLKQATIPPRPFMPLDGIPVEWTDSVLGILRDHFEGAANV